ncbi:hypothetical protein AVEN_32597-1 [Araneus ventricosus]|uniref:Reverse transcriptase RNase H-like domain-containing protein n=1 Tax=Araneus ventricosus TaxID=182803 RepID=A0A4Y2C794_ARAVE|nr:hypothetical protein AVEN_32597-1 [Araneus ventricosus]
MKIICTSSITINESFNSLSAFCETGRVEISFRLHHFLVAPLTALMIPQVDASKNGLGATLMQEKKPTMFASRSLNKTEQQYAQIKKKNVWRLYLLVKGFINIFLEKNKLETDHKPPETIFKKELLKAPRRLPRMLLRFQKYNLNVVFKKGEKCVKQIFSQEQRFLIVRQKI